jgi:D-alanyl-D-alanine carboxypeptidase
MRRLEKRMYGGDVAKWQKFLLRQGLDPGKLDADFGSRVENATRLFQTRNGTNSTSVSVDGATLARAVQLGFIEPEDYSRRPDFPPRPGFSYSAFTRNVRKMGEVNVCDTDFGTLEYVPDPVPGNPEKIRITNSFERDNIITVEIPQLRGVTRHTRISWNRRAVRQLVSLWQAWEDEGLLPLVLTWDGSYVPRLIRRGKTLSNHSLGTAFDINYSWNQLGATPAPIYQRGSVRELVKLANDFGFYWGGHYNHRLDGMHFEVVRLL